MNKVLGLTLCFMVGCLVVTGQSGGYFPDVYNGYFYHMALNNAAYVPDTGKIDITIGHKLMSGPFREISTTTLLAGQTYRSSKKVQVLRLVLGNEQEGEYINTPKAFLNYAYQLRLAQYMTLSAGLSLGATGIYLSAPSSTSSFYLPDGNVGLLYAYKTSSLGVSSFQIFNASSRAFHMRRYYHVSASSLRSLSAFWDLKMHALWRALPLAQDEYRLALLANYLQRFEFGIGLKNRVGVSVISQISVPLSAINQDLMISAVYNSYFFAKDRILPNSLELGVGLKLR